MNSICIITARGGSKRIPKKNIRDFNGKPMVSYAITTALKSGLFDEVMVSTDSEEIAEIARQYGASVPFLRSAETANDFATTTDVINEVLDEYEKLGKHFDIINCLYPCTPLVTAERLKEGYQMIQADDCDSVKVCIKFSTPPLRAYRMNEKGGMEYLNPQYANMRTQDFEPLYYDAGQFYFWKYDIYRGLKQGSGIGRAIIVDDSEAQDVDNLSDWKLAEIKYKMLHTDEQ